MDFNIENLIQSQTKKKSQRFEETRDREKFFECMGVRGTEARMVHL